MNHTGTKDIKTERLLLQRFVLSDAEAMFRNWASDPQVTQFMMWPTHTDVGVSEGVLRDWVASYERDNFYQWAIVPKDFGESIGSISAVRVNDKTEDVHIGYCIGQKWWHRGYTSEALAAIIKFFFAEVGANRVSSRHDPRNPNSGAVMKKCGMRYEGMLRQSDWSNQGICDSVYYAILREDLQ
ncbi:GNAT family acetyltransferase [Clostridia bacterium]|nr:GNAT family acetyltransferase [Clostridia bacterium]